MILQQRIKNAILICYWNQNSEYDIYNNLI